ncbi:M23 family metallopeptidase [Coleofasciculus sp. LEGE 07092]|uniref:M23 family metallopeptidase n=1 Tax=Coleofasciculus sp. LEGE 07092 TaxID=2777969 RepID=UPI0018810D2B|nr:M23 family metallopeptidase [Coleofasciculus sp. LEGE 07092]MBE9147611.1 M23 family metallopeptidase [Coleofasciculus sp. LEGE 07092]
MSSESERTKEISTNDNALSVFHWHPRLRQGLSLISSLGVLSSGLVVAQTDTPIDTGVAPATAPVAPSVKPAPAPAPAAAPKPAAPEAIAVPAAPVHKPAPLPVSAIKPPAPVHAPPPAPAAVRKPSAPAVEAAAPPTPKKPKLPAPNLSVPAPATVATPPKVILSPSQNQESAQTPVAPTNNYIDRTNYSVGATASSEKPAAVVLTERSTGCQTVSRNGRLASGVCGVSVPSQQTGSSGRVQKEPQLAGATRLPIPTVAGVGMPPVANGKPVQFNPAPRSSQGISPVLTSVKSPIRVNASRVPVIQQVISSAQRSTSQKALTYYNLSARPMGRTKISDSSFMFPLAIPAAITSLFGWRVHPITGDSRFHAGTDLGAAEGTPVLAAASGQVATANFLGGYGLTVILRHEDDTQESRYAHLSEIFVQSGDWVDQGSVIGRVGSTGFSTGPHLHFEWRHLTPDGWVAVDAGAHLEYALAQFIETIKVAQSTPQPDS